MTVASKPAEQQATPQLQRVDTQTLAALAKFWDKAQPHLAHIKPILTKAIPVIVNRGQQGASLVKRYYTEDAGRFMWNFILVFFGGQFALTIMAIQAFKLTGSVVIEKSMSQLREQFETAMARFQKDPDAREIFDANNDGVISLEEVYQAVMAMLNGETSSIRDKNRRLVSICMRCIDPQRLTEAATGFMMGSLAVIATLRSNMAKSFAIGTKIGEHLAQFLGARVQKPLYEIYPEHKKWVDVGLKSGSALVGIIVSFLLTRVINALNCALQGAEALSVILLDFAHRRGKLLSVRHGDALVQAFVLAMIFVGVTTQVKSGFRLPWYLKLLMLPAVVSENLLSIVSVA